MRQGALRGDLSLLKEGLSLGWSFGLGSLEELARNAERLEREIYLAGSLEPTARGIRFRLGNPPLRLGAFSAIRLWFDGRPVPPPDARVATDRRPEFRPLSAIGPADPLELDTGEGSRFEIDLPGSPSPGPHRVRIEWQSVAIPPVVWLEFVDEVGRHSGIP